jgi:adenylate cyclase
MSIRRTRVSRLRQLLLLAAPYGGATLLLAGLQQTGISQSLDLLLYDSVTSLRPARSAAKLPITIVGIGEDDIRHFGWPIDDAILCRGIERAAAAGASAIGLDLYRDVGSGAGKACLPRLIRREPRLIGIFNVAEAIGPIPGSPANQQAFNDLIPDDDNVIRRDLVHVNGQDASTVSLALRLVERASGNSQIRQQLDNPASSLSQAPWLEAESGGYHNLDAAGLQRMLPFLKPGSFRTLTLQQLADSPVAVSTPLLRGRIVLIGSTARSVKDVFEIPQSRFSRGVNQLLMPGVEVHALRTAALLEDQAGQPWSITTPPGWLEQALELLVLLAGSGLGLAFASLRPSVLSVLGAALALLLAGWLLLLGAGIWLGVALPVLSLLLMAAVGWLRRGLLSQMQRQQVQRLLGQTTSPAVAQQLWEQRDELLQDGRFEGRQLPVTILFSDTCSFTSVSERLTPAELLAWLNRGMALAVPAVTRRGGMVNKFTGDGMLAVFGAPISDGEANDARAAIEAALELQQGLETLNAELQAEGAPAMRMRVGIHSGLVLAGSMGSSERLEYAVIGDAVNCASRLESLEKERHDRCCRVLVSSTTRALYDADALQWLDWGPLHVKGRQEPLQVSELRGGSAPGPGALSPGSAPAAGPANRR